MRTVYRWVYQPCGCVLLTSRSAPPGKTMECPFGCGGCLVVGDLLFSEELAALFDVTEEDQVVDVDRLRKGEALTVIWEALSSLANRLEVLVPPEEEE